MNAILTMTQFIFPIITFPYISRILLPLGTGKVSFAVSVISYFAMFAQLGIPIYGIRACASVRDDKDELSKTVHELLILNIVMSIIVYLFLFTGLAIIPRFRSEKVLFIILSTTILFNTIGMEWLYKALEKYTFITVRSVGFKLIAMIAMFLFVQKEDDYIAYGIILIFAASASNVFNFFYVYKLIRLKPFLKYNLKQHLKPILIFFTMSCATTIYTNLDTVMLGFMKSDEDVGYYIAAVKIKTIFVSLVTSLGTVLLPRASYYVKHGFNDEFYRIARKAINFVIIFATPISLYFMLFAKEGIIFLSGNAYEGSILPMQIIMPTLLLIGFTNIMGMQILVPLGRERVVLYSVVAGAVIDLGINFFLIPKFSSAGAAIGTLAAEAFVWIIQYIALRGIISEMYKKIKYFSIIIGLGLGTVASIWTKLLNLSDFIVLIISAIFFFGAYVLILTISKESLTLEIERQVISKIKGKISNYIRNN
jgi:O-antigen/teichoic acid export membrane protein